MFASLSYFFIHGEIHPSCKNPLNGGHKHGRQENSLKIGSLLLFSFIGCMIQVIQDKMYNNVAYKVNKRNNECFFCKGKLYGVQMQQFSFYTFNCFVSLISKIVFITLSFELFGTLWLNLRTKLCFILPTIFGKYFLNISDLKMSDIVVVD